MAYGEWPMDASQHAPTDPLGPLSRVSVRAIPEHPADDGLFGPHSVVWRVHRDRSLPLAGIRSLMLQALHPLAMAGVAQHSNWKEDPFGRLAATSGYILTVTYADTVAARRAGERVQRIHERVRGVDEQTGQPYAAGDPALLLWVHAAMVDSIVEVTRRYGRGLDDADADAYVAAMVTFAEVVGVPRDMVPATASTLRAWVDGHEAPSATPAAREAMAIVLDPPGLDPDMRAMWQDLGAAAVGTLPEWARALYGWAEPAPELRDRETVRQLLGVLDFASELQPGVREARRRLDARMRA